MMTQQQLRIAFTAHQRQQDLAKRSAPRMPEAVPHSHQDLIADMKRRREQAQQQAAPQADAGEQQEQPAQQGQFEEESPGQGADDGVVAGCSEDDVDVDVDVDMGIHQEEQQQQQQEQQVHPNGAAMGAPTSHHSGTGGGGVHEYGTHNQLAAQHATLTAAAAGAGAGANGMLSDRTNLERPGSTSLPPSCGAAGGECVDEANSQGRVAVHQPGAAKHHTHPSAAAVAGQSGMVQHSLGADDAMVDSNGDFM